MKYLKNVEPVPTFEEAKKMVLNDHPVEEWRQFLVNKYINKQISETGYYKTKVAQKIVDKLSDEEVINENTLDLIEKRKRMNYFWENSEFE